MKNIIKIFRDDLKDISSNAALIIVLIGLAILPSLYAWFNIKASWGSLWQYIEYICGSSKQ